MSVKPRWDIFCRVIDNFGDIGVTWRLARQLAKEHGFSVRLWCDDLATLAHLAPSVVPGVSTQFVEDIGICFWDLSFAATDCADVVLETFACELPAGYLQAMARRALQPVWINLEYLSAENWVADCHRGASPHPRLPLLKHFFFPGFTAATGGLLREANLFAQRDQWQNDPLALWADIGVAPPRENDISVALFCYPNAALPALIDAWANSAQPVRCLVPQGHSLQQIAAILDSGEFRPGDSRQRGNLRIHALPFVPQARFDHLLWACDINFVRGEDSFVRAQWAARPCVWHIYPQDDEAHRVKLSAFLGRYCADLDGAAAIACRDFWENWNHGTAPDWSAFMQQHKVLATHARRWANQLAMQADLAENLVRFVETHL
jgi:uncharacterized repeat protein (TIGR03837 family)